MKLERLRPGQREAFNVILARIAAAEPRTAIVLPTRYGKSDLMRLVAFAAKEQGLSHGSIALSPGLFLRNQIVREDKILDMCGRYGLAPLHGRMRRMESARELDPFGNGEVLLSSTIQLGTSQMLEFSELCAHYRDRPIVLHIDECQETSEIKKRGEFVDKVIDAGGLVVLYTATPIRADGEVIPGFKVAEIGSEDIRRYVTTPIDEAMVRVDVFEGVRHVVELQADHTTTFQQAWDETPSPICQLSREVVDVRLVEIGGKGDEPEALMLSQAAPSVARKYLNKAARNPIVVERAARLFCNELLTRKRVNEHAAGIIFTSNDDGSVANSHAKEIQSVLRDVAPDLDVVIVTLKNEEGDAKAAEMIQRFVGTDDKPGRGDVLIVKQMGGAGLDCGRLKVLLDLSPVRTVASVIQRMMRVATPWGATTTASVITLADPLMSAIWEKFVVAQGGASVFTGTCDELDLVDWYKKPKTDDLPGKELMVDEAGVAAFDDHRGQVGDMSSLPFINELLRRLPSLTSLHTKAELSVALAGFGGTEAFEDQPEPQRSADHEIKKKHGQINALCDDKAGAGGRYMPGAAADEWAERRRDWMTRAKKSAGVPPGTKLSEITNLRTLNAIIDYLTA